MDDVRQLRAVEAFSSVTREDVQKALNDLDRGVEHPFEPSSTYDLLYEGRRYPPKAIIALAAKAHSGINLAPADFPGGEGTAAFDNLRRLGFEIVAKQISTGGPVKFERADCELFDRYPNSLGWADVSKPDQEQFKSIRRQLKQIAREGLQPGGVVVLELEIFRPFLDFPFALSGSVTQPQEVKQEPLQKDNYSIDDLADETDFDVETLKRWKAGLERKGQAIFYGPPGTGKTFIAERLAKHIVSGTDGLQELVQFHPAYSYEDFMQGIRPRDRPKRSSFLHDGCESLSVLSVCIGRIEHAVSHPTHSTVFALHRAMTT